MKRVRLTFHDITTDEPVLEVEVPDTGDLYMMDTIPIGDGVRWRFYIEEPIVPTPPMITTAELQDRFQRTINGPADQLRADRRAAAIHNPYTLPVQYDPRLDEPAEVAFDPAAPDQREVDAEPGPERFYAATITHYGPLAEPRFWNPEGLGAPVTTTQTEDPDHPGTRQP